jgi:hypothetical protein
MLTPADEHPHWKAVMPKTEIKPTPQLVSPEKARAHTNWPHNGKRGRPQRKKDHKCQFKYCLLIRMQLYDKECTQLFCYAIILSENKQVQLVLLVDCSTSSK